MMVYDRKIVVFGGAGAYMPAIKTRLCYNDLQIFDTDSQQWLKEPEIEGAPKKRMSHCSAILGGFLLVHGGFSTDQKQLLNEFGLFDLELNRWVQMKLYLVSE
jgi:N-acetylneuraminic acid mutarotase